MSIAPEATEAIRRASLRLGVVLVVAGASLAVAIPLVALAMPGGRGGIDAITIAGAVAGGVLVSLSGLVLLDARRIADGRSLLVARPRHLLLVLLVLSVGVVAACAYGVASVGDQPASAALAAPLTGTMLIAVANAVLRSLPADRGAARR